MMPLLKLPLHHPMQACLGVGKQSEAVATLFGWRQAIETFDCGLLFCSPRVWWDYLCLLQ